MSDWDHRESREVDHVMGAFFLIRRFIFEELGGFDEQFFVYLEDLDFSLRARQAGWHCFYLLRILTFPCVPAKPVGIAFISLRQKLVTREGVRLRRSRHCACFTPFRAASYTDINISAGGLRPA